MIPRQILTALLWGILTMTTGCIHTYPDPEAPVNPSLQKVFFELSAIQDWESMTVSTPRSSRNPGRRIIIEILRNDATITRKEISIAPDNDLTKPFRLPFYLRLEPRHYNMLVWMDYADASDPKPECYDASSLSDIKELETHSAWSRRKDCFCHVGSVDLTRDNAGESGDVVVPVRLERPLGRFRIVAEDYIDFIKANEQAIRKGETYSVEVNIRPGLPHGFNLPEQSPSRRLDYERLSYPLEIITIPGIEMEVAAEYLFCGKEKTGITADITVFSSAKAVVSKIRDVSFHVEKGMVTTVKGNFLTSYINSGITVDPSWNGEIDIDINPL